MKSSIRIICIGILGIVLLSLYSSCNCSCEDSPKVEKAAVEVSTYFTNDINTKRTLNWEKLNGVVQKFDQQLVPGKLVPKDLLRNFREVRNIIDKERISLDKSYDRFANYANGLVMKRPKLPKPPIPPGPCKCYPAFIGDNFDYHFPSDKYTVRITQGSDVIAESTDPISSAQGAVIRKLNVLNQNATGIGEITLFENGEAIANANVNLSPQ